MKRSYVYIMTNAPGGTLYIGVIADLATRSHQHRSGTGAGFCRQHGLTHPVHAEPHATMIAAIAREKTMKAWRRSWKPNLIGRSDPDRRDLCDDPNA